MRIDIVSDTVCPWCFVGKRRMERAIAQRPELDFEIHWHPFQLNPGVPAAGVDRDTYWEQRFGGKDKVTAITEQLAAVGDELDIRFDFDAIQVQPNTLKSHCLIAVAAGSRQSMVKEAILSAFFEQGKDIGDLDVLLDIAANAGLDVAQVRGLLSNDTLADQISQQVEMARSAGVTGVPTFIFDSAQGFSGAQPEEVFLEVFEQLTSGGETAAAP